MGKGKVAPGEHLVAGTVAGASSTAALYPLDTLKVRYQAHVKSGRAVPYGSLVNAFGHFMRNEGWRALYQGLPAAMFGAGFTWGGYFFFYEHAKARWLHQLTERQEQVQDQAPPKLGPLQHLLASWEAGTIMVFLSNPIWLIKTRMQLQRMAGAHKQQRLYSGFADAALTIVREEGVPALYKGTVPALFLVSHGVVQFMVYEALKEEAQRRYTRDLGPIDFLSLGAVAKIIASIATYPAQVIKTRIQQRNSASKYVGVLDCVTKTFQHEGLYGFYKGCLPNAIRVAPGAALTFGVYEAVVQTAFDNKRLP